MTDNFATFAIRIFMSISKSYLKSLKFFSTIQSCWVSNIHRPIDVSKPSRGFFNHLFTIIIISNSLDIVMKLSGQRVIVYEQTRSMNLTPRWKVLPNRATPLFSIICLRHLWYNTLYEIVGSLPPPFLLSHALTSYRHVNLGIYRRSLSIKRTRMFYNLFSQNYRRRRMNARVPSCTLRFIYTQGEWPSSL